MPRWATVSDYLKWQDLDPDQDTVLTIRQFKKEQLGVDKEEKWCLYFEETSQGLAVNATNGKAICKALGTDEMNDWVNKKIALFVKHDVQFGDEMVSAIRVRPKAP